MIELSVKERNLLYKKAYKLYVEGVDPYTSKGLCCLFSHLLKSNYVYAKEGILPEFDLYRNEFWHVDYLNRELRETVLCFMIAMTDPK